MRYQKVHSQIWNDEKFSKLSDNAKLLFIYIMSCDHSNAIGLFLLPKGYIQEDLRWSSKQLAEPFAELLRERLIMYDDTTRLVLVKNHLKHNTLENGNQVINAERIVQGLPRNFAFLSIILEQLNRPFHKRLRILLAKLLEEQFPKPEAETETEAEAVTEEDKGTSVPLSSSDDADPVIPSEDPPGNGNGKGHPPDCPVLKIVERYHTILPTFAKVQVLDKITRSNIRNRWHEDPQRWSLEWWDEFFRCVGASDFLSGRKTDFKANFSWLVGPKNFAKVLNGAYDNNRCVLGPKAQRNLASLEAYKRMVDEGKV